MPSDICPKNSSQKLTGVKFTIYGAPSIPARSAATSIASRMSPNLSTSPSSNACLPVYTLPSANFFTCSISIFLPLDTTSINCSYISFTMLWKILFSSSITSLCVAPISLCSPLLMTFTSIPSISYSSSKLNICIITPILPVIVDGFATIKSVSQAIQ